MIHKFTDVLNSLVNYFLLGDIKLLKSWKEANDLPDDLATEFTTNESGDKAVKEGIVLPMTGIEDHAYTIIFNLSDDTPELLKEGNRLQVRQGGYSLKVENGSLMLYTWRILERFTDEAIDRLLNFCRDYKAPMIEIENGWYSVEILGGESLQDSCYEPTFEFILKRTEKQEVMRADINYVFRIKSTVY